jgi:hypothetical protein
MLFVKHHAKLAPTIEALRVLRVRPFAVCAKLGTTRFSRGDAERAEGVRALRTRRGIAKTKMLFVKHHAKLAPATEALRALRASA